MNRHDRLIEAFDFDESKHSRDDHGRFDGNGGASEGKNTKGRLVAPKHADKHPGKPIPDWLRGYPPGSDAEHPGPKRGLIGGIKDILKGVPFRSLHDRILAALAYNEEDHPRDEHGRWDSGSGGGKSEGPQRNPRIKAAAEAHAARKASISPGRDEHGRLEPPNHADQHPGKPVPAQISQLVRSSAEGRRVFHDQLVEAFQKGNAQALIDWFNEGAGGAIDWGTPGDFEQCVEIASKHMDEDQAKGFCNERHQDATGEAPGRGAHGGGK